MSTFLAQPDNKQLIYLYDLPKALATSVRIATIIKQKTGYELPEPVQFRDCKPHPLTGLASPYSLGIIKVDQNEWKTVADAIKYFSFEDGSVDAEGIAKAWECRALPFDRDLLGANKTSTNTSMNVFVKTPKDVKTADLEKLFAESFGEVKSAKISRSAPVTESIINDHKVKQVDINAPTVSNGYGFVCFQTSEAANKAVTAGKLDEKFEIIRYNPRDVREIRRVYNNIYVKNFNPSWTEADLLKHFAVFGQIVSCVIQKKKGKDGLEKPFAFICYDKTDDKAYGPECASNAVTELHDKEIDEFKLYVQPAIPIDQRQAQVQREQQRFKNSKKKCNLFVKGFPSTFTVEDLERLFSQFGEIESTKLIPAQDGQPTQRAFVCFKSPDNAANARAQLHQTQTLDGKLLYVTNYELPEIRKKQQADAKDKADFMNFKRQSAGPLDPTLLARPDTIQLIQQILFLVQRQMGGRFPNQGGYNGQNNYGNNRPMNNGQPRQYNNNRQPGQYQQNQLGGNRPTGPRQNQYNQNQGQAYPAQVPVAQPTPQAAPAQVMIKDSQGPLVHPDPFIAAYNVKGFQIMPVVVPNNPNLKQFVGEFIYEFVESLVGEERAPKITGMLIDLPLDEIKGYLYDYFKLQQKVQEAILLLAQIQAQQVPQ